MRVTIGQINTTNGDYEGNTAGIIRAIEQGKTDAAELVVVPETCIQGYTSLDWFLDRDVARCVLQPLEKIIEATEGLTAIVGTVRPNDVSTGRRLLTIPATSSRRANAICSLWTVAKWAWPSVRTFGTTRPSGKIDSTRTIRQTN
jgi:predicted amidohydrolase